MTDETLELIAIAQIMKPQGRVGEVAAELLTDFPERFDELQEVLLKRVNGNLELKQLEDSWLHKGRVILKFAGVDSISAAEELAGSIVQIPADELVELPEDMFFDFQLEDCAVVDKNGHDIGRVREVVRTGGVDLLAVIDSGNKEHLIPLAESICVEIDVAGKRIVIDPPEGLLEL